jgi:hypothetical protein
VTSGVGAWQTGKVIQHSFCFTGTTLFFDKHMIQKLEKIKYRKGMLDKGMKLDALPVKVWSGTQIPGELRKAINQENPRSHPRSRLQKYRLTAMGEKVLKDLKKRKKGLIVEVTTEVTTEVKRLPGKNGQALTNRFRKP